MGLSPEPIDPQTRRQRHAKLLLAVALAVFGIWLSATFLPALIWAAVIGIAIDPLYQRAESRWPAGRKAAPTACRMLPGIGIICRCAGWRKRHARSPPPNHVPPGKTLPASIATTS